MRIDPMERPSTTAQAHESNDVKLGDFFTHARSGERVVCVEISHMLEKDGRHVVVFGVMPEAQA